MQQTNGRYNWTQRARTLLPVLDRALGGEVHGQQDLPPSIELLLVSHYQQIPARAGYFLLKIHPDHAQLPAPLPPQQKNFTFPKAPQKSPKDRPDCLVNRIELRPFLDGRVYRIANDQVWAMVHVRDTTRPAAAAAVDGMEDGNEEEQDDDVTLGTIDFDTFPVQSLLYCAVNTGSATITPEHHAFPNYLQQEVGVNAQGEFGLYNAEKWHQLLPTVPVAGGGGAGLDVTQLLALNLYSTQQIAQALIQVKQQVDELLGNRLQ